MPHHQHVLVTDPRSPTARPGTTISGSTRPGLREPDSAHHERHGPGSECGRGSPLSFGAYRADGGTNFSVWSRTATQLDLLLFDDVDDARPSRMIPLDPLRNRTSYFWHVLMPDVEPGQVDAWRVHGVFDPTAGLRHDGSALLLDPYGVAVTVPTGYDRMAGTRPDRDPRTAMKSVVADLSVYDWEGNVPLGLPFARTPDSGTSG